MTDAVKVDHAPSNLEMTLRRSEAADWLYDHIKDVSGETCGERRKRSLMLADEWLSLSQPRGETPVQWTRFLPEFLEHLAATYQIAEDDMAALQQYAGTIRKQRSPASLEGETGISNADELLAHLEMANGLTEEETQADYKAIAEEMSPSPAPTAEGSFALKGAAEYANKRLVDAPSFVLRAPDSPSTPQQSERGDEIEPLLDILTSSYAGSNPMAVELVRARAILNADYRKVTVISKARLKSYLGQAVKYHPNDETPAWDIVADALALFGPIVIQEK